jgi:hypothetical protein
MGNCNASPYTNGTDCLVLVDGHVVGSQRNATFAEHTALIDVSSKDSGYAQRVMPGRYSADVALDHMYLPTDAGYLALKAAKRNHTFVEVWRQEAGSVLESACAVVTELSEAAPDQDVMICSTTLVIDGEWESGS